MRSLILCALCLLPALLRAQEPCGAAATPEVLRWWDVRAQTLQTFARKGTAGYTVPVHIHIVGDDNGNGYYGTANAYGLVCELNQRFAPLQLSFFLDDSVTHINNSSYTNPGAPYVNQMMNAYNRPKSCNIYLVPQLTGLCGYSYFPGQGPALGRGGIVLKNGCSLPGNSDPAHEMGHYFSLLHTFQDWNTPNAELVNGSNCAAKGDHFCDTRADWQDFRWTCPYTGSKQDANGDYYMPDSSLYMGYSNAPCPARFSPQQGAAIVYSRANDRPYLDSLSAPSYPALTNVALTSPADGDPAVPSGNSVFKWHAVAGAVQYNLRIVPAAATSFASPVVNIITADTAYALASLQPGAAYRWEVVPLNYVASCIAPDAAGVQRRDFSVVFTTGIAAGARGTERFTLYPNPAGAGAELEISLHLDAAADVAFQVIGMDGHVVYTETHRAQAGRRIFRLPAGNWKPGVYGVRVSAADFNATLRFVKQYF